MKDSDFKLLKEIGKNAMWKAYQNHNREIEPKLWNKLKDKRICDECKEKFKEALYIHHRIPVRAGGTNTEENLMVVCWSCHEKLDIEQEEKYDNKRVPKNPEILKLLNDMTDIISNQRAILDSYKEYEHKGSLINIQCKFKSVQKAINELKKKV
jgi:5-methylcytosine-specific restriction protein A